MLKQKILKAVRIVGDPTVQGWIAMAALVASILSIK